MESPAVCVKVGCVLSLITSSHVFRTVSWCKSSHTYCMRSNYLNSRIITHSEAGKSCQSQHGDRCRFWKDSCHMCIQNTHNRIFDTRNGVATQCVCGELRSMCTYTVFLCTSILHHLCVGHFSGSSSTRRAESNIAWKQWALRTSTHKLIQKSGHARQCVQFATNRSQEAKGMNIFHALIDIMRFAWKNMV